MTTRTRRIIITATVLLLVALSFLRPFDRASEGYLDTALRNALVTFAVARVLNAGISVVQGTEVAISPAGVGVTLTPGEVLDPLNDLVERFSWVMLLAATSIGIQKLLLSIGASAGFSILISAALALYLLILWHPRWRTSRYLGAAFKLAAILVAVRFSMGIVLLGNEIVYQQFIEQDYLEASAGLEASKRRIETLSEAQQAAGVGASAVQEEGFTDRMRRLWDDTAEKLDASRHIDALQTTASEATGNVIRLIVVFVLQTILLPLIFLWALYRTVAALLAPARGRLSDR